MSFYSTSEGGTETTYSTGSSDSHKKESSTTAKTALGLGIAGLAVGLLSGASNCGNGRRNNCGGLLNGLFGNGCCENDELVTYRAAMYDQGRKAEAELAVVNTYFIPTWKELCDLRQEVAVNRTTNEKDQQITALLFQLAEQKAQCCCDKVNAKVDYVSALAEQRAQCNYDRLSSDIKCVDDNLNTKIDYTSIIAKRDADCNFERLNSKVDSAFIIEAQRTDAKICEATKNMVRGNVYLSPTSLANPYGASTDYLVSRTVTPTGRCGGYSGWNGCDGWSNWGGCGCNW